jgi:hypothetical protein
MSTRSEITGQRMPFLPPRGDCRSGASGGDDLLLASVYAPKKESIPHRYGKRIAGGIACALVVSVITHLPYMKLIILWICQIIIFIFGRPHGAERLEKLEDKAVHAIEKVKQVAHEHHGEGTIPKAAGPLAGTLAAVPAVKKLKEEIHAVKDVAVKAKAVEEKAQKGVEKIADAGHDIADALKGAGGKAKDAVGDMGAKAAEALRARKEAQEKAERDRLIVRARNVGLTLDESWSVTRLGAEVDQAEEIAWRKRYNAQCTNPRCRWPMRISDRGKHERFRCPRCQGIFIGGVARTLGPPPMPRRR